MVRHDRGRRPRRLCGGVEELEVKAMVHLIEVYEEKHWPLGKEAGGKG
jgi:hypothetical protein